MKVSPAAIGMIKHHEGVRNKPYRCPALLWTVGVGHVIDPTHTAVKYEERRSLSIPPGWDRVLSMGEVDSILAQDLSRFERGVPVCSLQHPTADDQHVAPNALDRSRFAGAQCARQ